MSTPSMSIPSMSATEEQRSWVGKTLTLGELSIKVTEQLTERLLERFGETVIVLKGEEREHNSVIVKMRVE